jgi:hypothetical protein
MNAFLKIGNELKELNAKFAAVLSVIFTPASAKASVSGENRGLACQAFASALPSLGKFDAIILRDDDGEITVKNEDLVTVLNKVTEAYNRMEDVRMELEMNEILYKSVRSFISANPSDGKRGRKPADLTQRYSLE